MTSNYWSQWDKNDLDSWQGKDTKEDEDDDEFEEDNPEEEESDCSCGYYCFDCLGMSCQNFM